MKSSNEAFSDTSTYFHNQVVVVTGASAGVGRAAALAFARQGARVALLARGKEGLESAQREVELAGGKALTIVVDVSDAEAVEAAADTVERDLGPIDVWVNNAMVTIFAPFSEIDAKEFKRVTEVTYLGGVYGTMAALKRMRTRDRGVIVQVSSALAYRSIPLQSAYCGAKHALVGFLDSLRSELIHDHSAIHVTTVEMPALNTPQFGWALNKMPNLPQPVPPIFQPEVAANAIVWAARNRRRSVPVGSPTWAAEWGQKLIPGLLDHYLGRHGYKGQQTDEPDNHSRANNLFDPVAGDPGTHGTFGDRSMSYSPALWVEKNRGLVFAAALTAGAGVALWCFRARSQPNGTNGKSISQILASR